MFVLYESSLPEVNITSRYLDHFEVKKINYVMFLIWTLSAVPIVTQIYFILSSGGIINYALDVIYRAEVWRGKGSILLTIQLIQILNIIYFVSGTYWRIKGKLWWIFFSIHFIF